jgi:ketosteroid isomerase-like protein
MTNADTVRDIYAAFGRGDVPAVLEHLADDVDWEYAYPTDHDVPWLTRRRGRDGALAFFQSMAADLEFTRFELNHVVGDGPVVVALASWEAKVKANSKTIQEVEQPQIWHFDARGHVIRFRHAADTLQHRRALEAHAR